MVGVRSHSAQCTPAQSRSCFSLKLVSVVGWRESDLLLLLISSLDPADPSCDSQRARPSWTRYTTKTSRARSRGSRLRLATTRPQPPPHPRPPRLPLLPLPLPLHSIHTQTRTRPTEQQQHPTQPPPRVDRTDRACGTSTSATAKSNSRGPATPLSRTSSRPTPTCPPMPVTRRRSAEGSTTLSF